MFDVPLKPSTLLTGSFDVDTLLAGFPSSYTVKGMFCKRFADMLGSDFAELAPKLITPPRDGRYVAFKDYPSADFTRIVVSVAATKFPELSPSEAVRRVARGDFEAFAESNFGRVMRTLISDPGTALLHMPNAFTHVAPGPQLSTEERDSCTVRVVCEAFPGLPEYLLGQLEGVVLAFGRAPVVTIHRVASDAYTFDVVHSTP